MIRFKVFLPVFALCVLVFWFFSLRFDAWLARSIESGISSLTQTKTDVRRLQTRFFPPKLQIAGLELASRSEPFKNVIEFEEILMEIELWPLLSRRLVIREFSIRGVDWGTDRKTSGRLVRPERSPSWLSPWVTQAMGVLREEFEELPVARLADFRIPENPQEILNLLSLESESAFREAGAKFEDAETRWRGRFSELRDLRDYQRFTGQFREATQDIPRDPQGIAERLRLVQSSIDFFQSERARVSGLISELQEAADELDGTYRAAQSAFRTDLERAKAQISLDQLRVDNLSRLIFGAHWLDRAEAVIQYQQLLRRALAWRASEQRPNRQVRPRQRGRVVQIFSPKAEPGFVWEFSEFSVRGLEREEGDRVSQSYELRVQGVNSSPKLYGKPTEIEVLGRFRESFLSSAKLELFFDYTTESLKDRYELSAENLKASLIPVGVSPVFPLAIREGSVSVRTGFHRVGESLSWVNRLEFSGVSWDLREVPQVGAVIPSLSRILESVGRFWLELRFEILDGKLRFLVSSDLDELIKQGVFRELEQQLQAFYRRLERNLGERVARVRDHAETQKKEFEREIVQEIQNRERLLRSRLEEAEKAKQRLEREARAQADRLREGVEDRVRGAGEDLLRRLPR
ncbi:MAG: TIGR03545 family protein [Bradymonadales bacterium]|nr:MAG: TIGR03545 family protein [Bradymonadales bacterium]